MKVKGSKYESFEQSNPEDLQNTRNHPILRLVTTCGDKIWYYVDNEKIKTNIYRALNMFVRIQL